MNNCHTCFIDSSSYQRLPWTVEREHKKTFSRFGIPDPSIASIIFPDHSSLVQASTSNTNGYGTLNRISNFKSMVALTSILSFRIYQLGVVDGIIGMEGRVMLL